MTAPRQPSKRSPRPVAETLPGLATEAGPSLEEGPTAGDPAPEQRMSEGPSDPASRLSVLARFANSFPGDPGHTDQVLRLALLLFEALTPLHGMGATERFWLHCAALVHDIGWTEGRKGHHKRALERVLDARDLPFDPRERLLIGNVARYHRRALPDPDRHPAYASLDATDRKLVSRVAAILRLADGLDASHQHLVETLSCRITPKKVVLTCNVRSPSREDEASVNVKADLFEEVFHRRLEIAWVFTDAQAEPPQAG
jgi:exopolyphosphatase/pppGpp-phosphohydrolase